MKITDVKLYRTADVPSPAVSLQIDTDAGITGYGAEGYLVSLIPHNNVGALGLAANLHASLAIPNIALLEASWVATLPASPVVGPWPTVREGHALPPRGAGLEIEFDEAAAQAGAFVPRPNAYLQAPDGSIRDW